MGSGVAAAASFAGSGAEFLISLHAVLPWQFPWQSVVPLCLSFLIHKAGGAHSTSVSYQSASLCMVCTWLKGDQTVGFLGLTHQETSSSPNLKDTWKINIFEPPSSPPAKSTHHYNLLWNKEKKILIVQNYLLSKTPTSKSMHSLQTWTCSIPGLGKVPASLVSSTVFWKPHRSMHYMNLPALA